MVYSYSMSSKYKTLLAELNEVAGSFLKANGGMNNGYETYIKGKVSTNGAWRPTWLTPGCDELTNKEIRRRGELLWRALCEVLKRYELTEGVAFEADHIEYGCFETYATVTERERLRVE